MGPESYFFVSDGGVKLLLWGDSNSREGINEAVPVALFPEPVPEDLVKDFLTTLTVKDPQGEIGKAVKKSVEAQFENEKQAIEASGLPAGEIIPESAELISPDDIVAEGPFVV